MSCLLTKGRLKGCKDGVSGVLNIYFINSLLPSQLTKDADGVVTAVSGTPTAYKYELRADAEFIDTIMPNDQNGTTYFEQKLTADLHHLDASTHKEIKLLAYSSPRIVVETNAGQLFLMGEVRGCDMTAGSIKTGKAMGDMNGYSMEFTAKEPSYAPFMDGSMTDLGFTVVPGT